MEDSQSVLQVYDGEKTVKMTMAEYLPGVVRGEMPATFEEFVSQRKGGANYIFKCHGISAHSGVEPEKGASAILELSRWVNELYKLNDFAAGTTVNVGRFDGGGDTQNRNGETRLCRNSAERVRYRDEKVRRMG